MSEKNWRTDVDSVDYFQHQKKRAELADRRPVIRNSSDLVGPGIGANTVRLDDLNDLLATFNGYYSALADAGNAPNSTEVFIGYTASDSLLGGLQVFTGLTSGTEYRRRFVRSPIDPEALAWGEWQGNSRVLPFALGDVQEHTEVLSGVATQLYAPSLVLTGQPGTFELPGTRAGIKVLRQGIYTGVIQVGDEAGTTLADVTVWQPAGLTTKGTPLSSIPLGPTKQIPFTVIALDGAQGFHVSVNHAAGEPRYIWWRFSCTRVGDAV